VSVREPMEWRSYIGPDGSGWSALLQEILLLRSRDGASPTTYYYGIFAPTSTFRSFCNRGCVLGLGPLAGPNEPLYRGAIGIGFSGDTAPGTAVHELGHAYGRPHAPCGVNDSDPEFPYADGGIGEWGYDVLTGTLKSPGLHSDFMSYCDPTWVSDYTYTALADRIDLVNHTRSAYETSGPPETWRMLSLGEDGATWGGTFETPKPPAGEPVAVEFLDSAGVVLEVGEGAAVRIDHVDSKLISVPPAPDGTAFVRIEGGAVIVY